MQFSGIKNIFTINNKQAKPTYFITRFVLLRFLGFVYFFAFLSLATQVIPLIGENGLLPAKTFLSTFHFENKFQAFIHIPAIFWLGISDIQNLLSPHQYMNTSFTRIPLVNTYGAFGSVGKERYELILEGTSDDVINSKTLWGEYEFKAKPGSIYRKLPIIAPYQPRIDWQVWFAAMERPEQNPWLIHLIWKLLHNDKLALSLLANNPFPDNPPKYIRVKYYRYKFTEPGTSTAVWERGYAGEWLPPLSRDNPQLQNYIKAYGWRN